MEQIPFTLENKKNIPIHMYEVPGHDEISDRTLKRYLRKRGQDKIIKEKIETKTFSWDKEHLNPETEINPVSLEEGLKSDDIKTQKYSAEMIMYAPQEMRADLIINGLKNTDPEIKKICARNVLFVSLDKQDEVRDKIFKTIEDGIDNKDMQIKKYLLSMTPYVAKEKQAKLEKEALRIVDKGFNSNDATIKKVCAEMIWTLPQNKRLSFIKQALETSNPDVQRASLTNVWRLNNKEKKSLLNIIMKRNLTNLFVQPSLYDNYKLNNIDFSREEFDKTGSETTLIGGEMKGKTIIRHVEPEAFISWQRLYEDYELWKENKFDYVPIEPIQSYSIGKDGIVDVYSGVLDLDLQQWLDISNEKFMKELMNDKKKIINVLKNEGVDHGHPHDKNFALRFYRDENGNADLTKKPRIYLIDFDKASSPEIKDIK